MAMYFGAPVWPLKWNPPYDGTINRLHDMGFKGVELIGWDRKALDEYYTKETTDAIKKQVADLGMVITNFNHTPEGIASLDPELSSAKLDEFYRTIDVAAALGSKNVTQVAGFPFGKSHWDFIELRHLAEMQVWSYGDIAPEADWQKAYDHYVEVLRKCCLHAKELGLRVLLEPHPYRWVNNTPALLRMFEHVGMDNLGCNFDPSHMFPAGDMPEWAVHQLKGRLWHTHFSDNDALTNVHWRPGQGKINWKAVMKALHDIGYDGTINFELEDVPGAATPTSAVHNCMSDEMEYELHAAKDYIAEQCRELNIEIG